MAKPALQPLVCTFAAAIPQSHSHIYDQLVSCGEATCRVISPQYITRANADVAARGLCSGAKGSAMRVKFAVAISILLAVPCFCSAQSQQTQTQQQTQSSSQSQSSQQSPSAPTPNGQAPLRVDGNVMVEKLVRMVDPIYPTIAQMARVSGTVMLDITISTDGKVRRIKYISGPVLLGRAAMAAVSQWQFEPTLLNGQPVEVETTVPVRFSYGEPEFTIKLEIRPPGSSSAILTESVEAIGAGKKANWASFIGFFEASTSHVWLDAIPSTAEDKQGKVSVEFDMRHDGSIDGVLWLTHSSHDPAIDDAAKLAMRKCAPFQSVPADFPYPTVNFRVTFAYDHPHPVTSSPGTAK